MDNVKFKVFFIKICCFLVVAHQDATYLYTEPVKVVGVWIALDDATVQNGCLQFAKGSHKSGVHRRYIRNPDKNSDELIIYTSPAPYYQKSSFVSTPVSKGVLNQMYRLIIINYICFRYLYFNTWSSGAF